MALAYNYTYTANGTEGTSVTVAALVGQKILFLFKGDKCLVPTTGVPGINDFSFILSTGQLTFGSAFENGQVLQVIYRQA